MTHDRVILVAGLPSGGTSTVAGTLYHLGVDMGDVRTQASPPRNYLGFECETANRECGRLSAGVAPDVMLRTARQYFERRLASANGPVGVKLNVFVLLGQCDGVETLPIAIVQVRRDLATTFASDIRYTGENYDRAASRGMQHLGLHQLIRKVPPVCIVDYEDAIKDPAATVKMLIDALGITPTHDQIADAIGFINPEKCKECPNLYRMPVTAGA